MKSLPIYREAFSYTWILGIDLMQAVTIVE